jgi:hypothetical protein
MLGEYASILASRGVDRARRDFPEVAAHLSKGCPLCVTDLGELLMMLGAAEPFERGILDG